MIGFLVGLFVLEDISVVVVAVCVFGIVLLKKKMWGKEVGMFIAIGLIGVSFGILRVLFADVVFDDDVRHLNGAGMRDFEACVASEVDVRFDKVKYTVSGVSVAGEEFSGKVLINADRYPVYEYGDVLSIVGEFESPEPIEGFAYDKYLARYEIYSVVNSPRVEKVGNGCGRKFFEWIYGFKGWIEGRISVVFSEPHGSMVAGLLLGVRKGIPEAVTEDFNETGLTHIVAISGYNITLVIILVFGLFGFLSRKGRVIAASIVVIVFVILVGASSAVVRAAIMGILGLFAVYFGRKNEVAMAIVLSAFLMNLLNPKIAIYDTGFQLSFLATLGLVYVSPKIEAIGGVFGRALARVPVAFAIRENLIMTLSAQAFALPVILKSFGRFSLICPLANIFVVPFIPIIMLVGAVAIVTGGVVAYSCYVLLEVVFFLVRVFAELSRAL